MGLFILHRPATLFCSADLASGDLCALLACTRSTALSLHAPDTDLRHSCSDQPNRICLIAQCTLCFSHSLNLTELPQPDRPDHPTNVCTSPRCTASRPATTPLFILRLSPSCSCSRVLLAPSPPPPPPRLKRRRPLHLGLLHTPQPRLPSQPGFPASCSSLALILRPPSPPPASFVFLDCCT